MHVEEDVVATYASVTHLENEGFRFFNRLPAEIRYKIYVFAFPNPRLIPLTYIQPGTGPASPREPDGRLSSPRHHVAAARRPCPSYALTTPAPPPRLLHVSRESRLYTQFHYPPSFPLLGSPSPSPINFAPEKDVLYFPSQPGYLASFKNFTNFHTLVDPTHLRLVERIAVHEDLFLEEEKRRWADLGQAAAGRSAGEGGRGRGRAPRGRGQGGGGGGGGGGIDGVTRQSLAEFWDVLRRKFERAKEVWIIDTPALDARLLLDDFLPLASSAPAPGSGRREGESGGAGRKRRLSFEAKVGCAVDELEARTRWVAPRWRVLSSGGGGGVGGGNGDGNGDGDGHASRVLEEDGGMRGRGMEEEDGYLGGNRELPRPEFILGCEETLTDKAGC